MVPKSLLKSLVVFATIFSLGTSKSTFRHQRDAIGGLEAILESQVNSFPATSFATDVQVSQHVDRANKISTYKLLNENETIYERNHDDSAKDVVILSHEEDKLPFKKTKRAYIVLKKTHQASNYFGELAILRDATAQDKNPVSINGANRVIEWLYFEEHVIQGRSHSTLSILTCTSSVLIPCMFNESALTPPEKFVTAKRYAPKQGPNNIRDEVEGTKLQTSDGSDSDDNYDLYMDLEFKKVEGRGLLGDFFASGLVPGLLSVGNGLICGVMTILGTCGVPAGTDTTIINNSGQDLTPEQIKQALYGKRKKREVGAPNSDKSLDYPGWKTQYVNPTKDITFQHDKEIFYGFGNCPYVQVKPADLVSAKGQDEILNYYVTVLRAECTISTKPLLEGIIKDGLLVLKDKTFELVSDHKSLNQPKLNLKELLDISSATEFAAFSNVYSHRAHSPPADAKATTPDGHKEISRSIHFIGQVGLVYIKITREKTRSHILHLTRNLLQNINSVFGKLAQDDQNMEKCPDCTRDKEINLNDRLYVMTLTQFIKKGLGPVERGADVFTTFDAFYKLNEDVILKFVNLYS